MEVNEIITNEEVIEAANEAVKKGIGDNFKLGLGIGLGYLAVIAIMQAGKYAVKPIAKKALQAIKDKKNAKSGSDTERDIIGNEEYDEEENTGI